MRIEPVYAWPVVGTLAYRAVYGLLRATLVPVMRLQHFKRLQRGTFVLWAPPDRIEIAVKALEFLETHDERTFRKLTRRPKVIMYFSEQVWQRVLALHPIHKRYFEWGAEAVAAFLVQSVLMDEANPRTNPYRLSKPKLAAVNAVPEKVFDWMRSRPIPPEFMEAYRGSASRDTQP